MRRVTSVVCAALSVVACSVGGGGPPPSPSASLPVVATVGPSMPASPAASPTGTADATEQTAPPSATAPASGVATPALPVAVPAARLGGGPAGVVGSYTFGGEGTDAPWLPARMLEPAPVSAGAAMEIRIDDLALASWSARVAPGSDTSGETATGAGEGGPVLAGDAIRIDAPKTPGEWVLMAQVVFADDAGDAAYYWRLSVT